MYVHDATEQAYKHGYERGYEAGKKDFSMERWISINEKLPTKFDADEDGCVMAIYEKAKKKIIVHWEDVCRFKDFVSYWTYLPKLPMN